MGVKSGQNRSPRVLRVDLATGTYETTPAAAAAWIVEHRGRPRLSAGLSSWRGRRALRLQHARSADQLDPSDPTSRHSDGGNTKRQTLGRKQRNKKLLRSLPHFGDHLTPAVLVPWTTDFNAVSFSHCVGDASSSTASWSHAQGRRERENQAVLEKVVSHRRFGRSVGKGPFRGQPGDEIVRADDGGRGKSRDCSYVGGSPCA